MMPSTKRYLIVLVAGLVLCLSGTLAAANGHEGHENEGHRVQKVSFPGGGWMMNPCPGVDNSAFYFDGTNVLRYHVERDDISIHLRFTGTAMHGANPVKFYLHANTHAEAHGAGDYSGYVMPFESVWIEKGSPNFKLLGNISVGLNRDGTGFANILGDASLQLVCTNDRDNDADRKHDDDDKDDRN
jgi:hypothetical protein